VAFVLTCDVIMRDVETRREREREREREITEIKTKGIY
jgi:hypothetical protein